jgi:hypothetical protein
MARAAESSRSPSETKQITCTDGTARTLQLFARGGAFGIAENDDTGELTFTELHPISTHRAADCGAIAGTTTTSSPPSTAAAHHRPPPRQR